jgi:hypothetical protein
MELQRRSLGSSGTVEREVFELGDDELRVNLAVLDALARSLGETELVLVDVSRYFQGGASRSLEAALEELAARRDGVGYLPLGAELAAANARGEGTRWRHDPHFNEAGNRIFAGAMQRYVESSGRIGGR